MCLKSATRRPFCCDVTSTIRRLYRPNSEAYEALRAENSRKMKEYWKGLSPEKKKARLDKCRAGGFQDGRLISKGASRRSRAPFNNFTCIEHISTSPLV